MSDLKPLEFHTMLRAKTISNVHTTWRHAGQPASCSARRRHSGVLLLRPPARLHPGCRRDLCLCFGRSGCRVVKCVLFVVFTRLLFLLRLLLRLLLFLRLWLFVMLARLCCCRGGCCCGVVFCPRVVVAVMLVLVAFVTLLWLLLLRLLLLCLLSLFLLSRPLVGCTPMFLVPTRAGLI